MGSLSSQETVDGDNGADVSTLGRSWAGPSGPHFQGEIRWMECHSFMKQHLRLQVPAQSLPQGADVPCGGTHTERPLPGPRGDAPGGHRASGNISNGLDHPSDGQACHVLGALGSHELPMLKPWWIQHQTNDEDSLTPN